MERDVTAHSPTLPSLYLRHNSFSNPSVASSTSQLILQPFFRFFYVTGFHLRHLAQGGACVSQANALQEMTLSRSTPYTCTSIARIHTLNLLSSLKITERHTNLQSYLSRHQNSRSWFKCRGVSGSLNECTSDLSPSASRRFLMVLSDTAGATCAQISSGCCSGGHHCSHNASILTCVCTTRPSRTWSTTHHRYILANMCINPSIFHLAFRRSTMTEVVHRSIESTTVLPADTKQRVQRQAS